MTRRRHAYVTETADGHLQLAHHAIPMMSRSRVTDVISLSESCPTAVRSGHQLDISRPSY